MTRNLKTCLKSFLSEKDGSAAIEFVFIFPLFLFVFFSSIELGLITARQSMLERALDQTVRDIRLGTGEAPQHDEIRDSICERSLYTQDCANSVKLEMVQVDPYDWDTPPQAPDCVDTVEVVQPVRNFTNGQSNELMFLRACLKFEPIFPFWGLGGHWAKDDDDRISLFASSAFVQEPR